MKATIRYARRLTASGEFEDVPQYFLDGVRVSKRLYDAALPDAEGIPAGPPLKGWPLVSNAAAVHPRQVEEAKALDRKKGVPTEYTPAGQPVLRDRAHRKRYLKAHGLRDNEAGYGD